MHSQYCATSVILYQAVAPNIFSCLKSSMFMILINIDKIFKKALLPIHKSLLIIQVMHHTATCTQSFV